MLQNNLFIRLIRKKAHENFYNSGKVREVALKASSAYRRSRQYLHVYNYDPEYHREKSNKHDALNSIGCGCALCRSRHEYTKIKREYKQFVNYYENDRKYHLFWAIYRDSNTSLTEEQYFNRRSAELLSLFTAAFLKHRSIKQTIDLVLNL